MSNDHGTSGGPTEWSLHREFMPENTTSADSSPPAHDVGADPWAPASPSSLTASYMFGDVLANTARIDDIENDFQDDFVQPWEDPLFSDINAQNSEFTFIQILTDITHDTPASAHQGGNSPLPTDGFIAASHQQGKAAWEIRAVRNHARSAHPLSPNTFVGQHKRGHPSATVNHTNRRNPDGTGPFGGPMIALGSTGLDNEYNTLYQHTARSYAVAVGSSGPGPYPQWDELDNPSPVGTISPIGMRQLTSCDEGFASQPPKYDSTPTDGFPSSPPSNLNDYRTMSDIDFFDEDDFFMEESFVSPTLNQAHSEQDETSEIDIKPWESGQYRYATAPAPMLVDTEMAHDVLDGHEIADHHLNECQLDECAKMTPTEGTLCERPPPQVLDEFTTAVDGSVKNVAHQDDSPDDTASDIHPEWVNEDPAVPRVKGPQRLKGARKLSELDTTEYPTISSSSALNLSHNVFIMRYQAKWASRMGNDVWARCEGRFAEVFGTRASAALLQSYYITLKTTGATVDSLDEAINNSRIRRGHTPGMGGRVGMRNEYCDLELAWMTENIPRMSAGRVRWIEIGEAYDDVFGEIRPLAKLNEKWRRMNFLARDQNSRKASLRQRK